MKVHAHLFQYAQILVSTRRALPRHGLPATVVYTDVPKACIQAMAWSDAVEPTKAAQETTTVGLRQFQQLLTTRKSCDLSLPRSGMGYC